MSSTVTETQTTIERWTADPGRTTVEFEVAHLGALHTVHGRFHGFDGSYVVGPAGSEIELTIDAASVDTGNAARDKHLRSADFFDVAEHPQVQFTSKHITGVGNGRAHVSGELEAAGTTVPVAFDIGARDRRRARARGDDHGRSAPHRYEPGPASQRPAADEAPREDAPRARTARIKPRTPRGRCHDRRVR
jgi:polyisoprenoid-binding protein YceI